MSENSIQLRLRFVKKSSDDIETLLMRCKKLKENLKPNYRMKIIDNHIWLGIAKHREKQYSPNVHLEVIENEDETTTIKGLFGPNPTQWTLFMFLHFIVAGIFIIFGMIAYSNHALNQSITFSIIVMITMVITWILLYFIARNLRKKGLPQMHELENIIATKIIV